MILKKQDKIKKTQKSGPPKGRSRPRTLIRLGIVLLLMAGIYKGISWYRHTLTHESTEDAFIDGHIVQVSPRISGHIVQVKVKDNQWVKKGDVLVELDPADYEIELNAALAVLKSAGVAASMRAVDVDLTTIASQSALDDAQAAVTAAQANVAVAKAQKDTAEGRCEEIQLQIRTAGLDLDLAKAQAQAARAEHVRNQTDLRRYRQMQKTETISKQQVEHMAATTQISAANLAAAKNKIMARETTIQQYQAALATAGNQLAQARAQVRASQSRLEQAKAGLRAAQAGPRQVDQSRSMTRTAKADLEKAEAGVAQARLNLSHTRILAETSGFVSNRSAEPGMFVQKGQSLMAIVSNKVWVTANFKETQLSSIRPGQPVTIRVDTYPGTVFSGRVDSIQHGTGSRFSLLPAQNATGNFVKVVQRIPVKIFLERQEGDRSILLMPGMSAVPEIDTSASQAGPETASSSAVTPPPHQGLAQILKTEER